MIGSGFSSQTIFSPFPKGNRGGIVYLWGSRGNFSGRTHNLHAEGLRFSLWLPMGNPYRVFRWIKEASYMFLHAKGLGSVIGIREHKAPVVGSTVASQIRDNTVLSGRSRIAWPLPDTGYSCARSPNVCRSSHL